MNYLLENKRRLAGILGFLLIVISLALGFLTKNNETMNYIDIIFPQNIFHGMFQAFLYVIYPILILSVILVIINFTSKRRIILYTIFSILTLGLHVLLYFWAIEAFPKANMGIGWYITGIGVIILIVAPFLEKAGAKSSETND
ncbi:uncharacterized protein METZ01_LOCUS222582 [marine metagenome]|uniref:Uncharacterized protein n=1 Tax=marine metagenome TaxID=408172 RepID=A0A382G390_9ZZZZ